jgi:hypothetical protein
VIDTRRASGSPQVPSFTTSRHTQRWSRPGFGLRRLRDVTIEFRFARPSLVFVLPPLRQGHEDHAVTSAVAQFEHEVFMSLLCGLLDARQASGGAANIVNLPNPRSDLVPTGWH